MGFVAEGGNIYRRGGQSAPRQRGHTFSLRSPGGNKNKAGSNREGTRQVLIKNTGEAVWVPPEAYDARCAKVLKRRMVAKERDIQRSSARQAKQEVGEL